MMDDGIGVRVVEELKKQSIDTSVEYVVGETDIDYCLDQIYADSYMIIVDAAYLGEKPGTISIIPLDQVLESPTKQISVHESHFLNEIRISGKNIKGVFIAIEPCEINYGTDLSSGIQGKFKEIVKHIGEIIQHIVRNY
jgi:hydrogenase maturation protease